MHALIDLWGCDKKVLGDEARIVSLLYDWVEAMGMTTLGKPVSHSVKGKNPGVTAIQVITESHLSIHTFTDSGHAWVDLFSCKDFEVDTLVRSILAALGGELAEYQMVERGFSVLTPRGVAPWWQVGKPGEVPEGEPT